MTMDILDAFDNISESKYEPTADQLRERAGKLRAQAIRIEKRLEGSGRPLTVTARNAFKNEHDRLLMSADDMLRRAEAL